MPQVKLGDVAVESRETYKGDKTGMPIVGLEHLTPGEVALSSWDTNTENTFTKRFRKGDMLFGRRRAYLKKAAQAPFDGICSGDITVIRAKEDLLLPELLPFIIQNDHLFDFAVGKSAGSLSPRVKWENLKNYTFELPPVDEQKKLAEVLWSINDTLQAYQNLLTQTDALVQAQFVEMFGDPVSNPYGWRKHKLIDVCNKLTDGTHSSPENSSSGEYKYITAKNIKEDGFDFSNLTYVTQEIHDPIYTRCNPEQGDVLYIKDGVTTGIAMVNPLKEQFTMLSSVALLKQNRSLISGEFLCSVLNNKEMYNNIRSSMGGAAITRLTIKKLSDIMVILPPLELQKKFVSIKEQSAKSKSVLQNTITSLQATKRCILETALGNRGKE